MTQGYTGSASLNSYDNGLAGGRLTLSSANPTYNPLPATAASTDTTAETCTFSTAHGWTTGTIITVATTVGGLVAGTTYYINALSTTTVAFYTTLANALADSSRFNLTANVTQKITPRGVANTTLYYTFFTHDKIALFDGVSSWIVYTFAELSLALTLTSGSVYDVFIYNNNGVLTLEVTVWASTTARTTSIVRQNGIWVKSGATTRRYLGTIYATATNTTEDSWLTRGVWNYNNQTQRLLFVKETADSYGYTTTTYRNVNGVATNAVNIVTGIVMEQISLQATLIFGTSANGARVAIGEDGIVPDDNCIGIGPTSLTNSANGMAIAQLAKYPSIGYHTYNWLERGATGVTIYGDNGDGTLSQSGMSGFLMG